MGTMTGAALLRELSDTSVSDRSLGRWKNERVPAKPTGVHDFVRDNASLEIGMFLEKLLAELDGDKNSFYDFLDNISTESLVFLAHR